MKLDTKNEPPQYLSEQFFKAALEDGLRDMRVDIKKIIFAESNGGGENYCSKIYRARALYRSSKRQLDEELALIVKTIDITPATQFLQELAVFLREKIFYFDVLGRLEVLIGDGSKFGPKCLYTTRDPIQTIVFDDLTQYGYKLASRQNGIDEEHCIVLLQKLGKFHAASMVLLEKDPSIREHFLTGMLDENYVRTNQRFINSTTLQLRTLANVVAKWGVGYQTIAQKLHRHCDNIKENLVRTGKAIPSELTVLNHGDLWVNNFMYKYDAQDTGKPIDTIFIDFQTSFFGSPGCDINFFLYSSVQLDVLVNRRDFLIRIYYEALRSSLQRMHYEHIPTLHDIQMEIRARELYGFYSSYAFLPMVAMRKEDSYDNSIEALTDMEFARKKVQLMFNSNPRTTETLRYALKRFDELGIFD